MKKESSLASLKENSELSKLQVEEREIVADIVQKISKSEDLLPQKYKKR